jgi:hypothetical protein
MVERVVLNALAKSGGRCRLISAPSAIAFVIVLKTSRSTLTGPYGRG